MTGWIVLAAVGAAAATTGGCSAPAEREQYLASRAVAIEPGAASGTDRPLAMFSGDLFD